MFGGGLAHRATARAGERAEVNIDSSRRDAAGGGFANEIQGNCHRPGSRLRRGGEGRDGGQNTQKENAIH